MNSTSDQLMKQYGRVSSPKLPGSSDVFEPTLTHNYDEAKQLAILIEWINSIVPGLNLPAKASSEELRACLVDGIVLLQILNRFKPGSTKEGGGSENSRVSSLENVKKFLACMDEMGIPKFDVSDLEKGSVKNVMDCLLTLRAQYFQTEDNIPAINTIKRIGTPHGDSSPHGYALSPSGEEKRKMSYRNAVLSEPSAATMHHVGHKFHEVFQLKQGRYADLSAAKISEMMKSNSLDNAPTQSLLSVVNGILDVSIEKKNGEIPQRVALLLQKVVQEIERRISTQAEHLRTQNNLFKAREEKYQSRIRVLEALASGTGEENGIVMDQLQKIKMEKSKMEEKKKLGEEEALKLMKEKEQINLELLALKQELEMEKKMHELWYLKMETEAKGAKAGLEEATKLIKEKEQSNFELSAVKQELEMAKKAHELSCLQMEAEAKGSKARLEERLKDLEKLLEDSRNNVKFLEANSESTRQKWSKKEHVFRNLLEFQFGALQELRLSSKSIESEVVRAKDSYSEEVNRLGIKMKEIINSTENYHLVLAENRRMYNELQDLKGNIRVYCRIRPFLPGQTAKKTIIEYIGEDGELIIANPNKPGKDGQRMFRFNKVYGPDSTQAKVFSDTQPLIRSVLDGYNVCIFAYGQTGSGKTYTMTGPNGATEEEWGVNYRALNDLFNISQNRKGTFVYEVGVQMVEIYNEQVRDLLSNDGPQKRLGILSASQSNGLAVPDASMNPVTSTSDVLELMEIGFKNRAMSATALNERSSRSHSVVSINVRGKDLKNGTSLHGNLHLVDLAGSERVDRSEVTGDRLKEAQHINKSLSALGDVIFALAQKSAHVPYRNSKLTQLLQSSLGGQAKKLMFVQLNPDASSYSETMSTLKFAERVSGVELGAARSNKEGRDVRELMEQVASLKDTITKKDEEIEWLQLLKDLKSVYPGLNGEKKATTSSRYAHSTSSNDSVGSRRSQKSPARTSRPAEKAGSDQDNNSEQSDKHSEGENLGYGVGDYEEKLSDMSDSALSAGTEHNGSAYEGSKSSEKSEKSREVSKIRSLHKPAQTASFTKDSLRASTGIRKTSINSTLVKPPKRWT